jgi:hypothetical protein
VGPIKSDSFGQPNRVTISSKKRHKAERGGCASGGARLLEQSTAASCRTRHDGKGSASRIVRRGGTDPSHVTRTETNRHLRSRRDRTMGPGQPSMRPKRASKQQAYVVGNKICCSRGGRFGERALLDPSHQSIYCVNAGTSNQPAVRVRSGGKTVY